VRGEKVVARQGPFHPSDVTRIDLGGGYEEALLLVAGEPPLV
jgi:hypothetical protein